jgi:fatty acid desaturase
VSEYRPAHLEHHRDFVLTKPHRFDFLHEEIGLPRMNKRQRTWSIFVAPLLGFSGVAFVRNTMNAIIESPRRWKSVGLYWAALLTIAWYLGWLSEVAMYWILPLVWLYPVFNLWAEVSDHFATKNGTRNQRGLFYRTFLKGHELYHAVHHLYPYVPFYRIHDAHSYATEAGVEMEYSDGFLDFLSIPYRKRP